jgi:hypothetical protein
MTNFTLFIVKVHKSIHLIFIYFTKLIVRLGNYKKTLAIFPYKRYNVITVKEQSKKAPEPH